MPIVLTHTFGTRPILFARSRHREGCAQISANVQTFAMINSNTNSTTKETIDARIVAARTRRIVSESRLQTERQFVSIRWIDDLRASPVLRSAFGEVEGHWTCSMCDRIAVEHFCSWRINRRLNSTYNFLKRENEKKKIINIDSDQINKALQVNQSIGIRIDTCSYLPCLKLNLVARRDRRSIEISRATCQLGFDFVRLSSETVGKTPLLDHVG